MGQQSGRPEIQRLSAKENVIGRNGTEHVPRHDLARYSLPTSACRVAFSLSSNTGENSSAHWQLPVNPGVVADMAAAIDAVRLQASVAGS
jgi:hypothetical protein